MTIHNFIEEWNNSSDYVVAHTSGSTGTPKEIRLFKRDMLASAKVTNGFFGITEKSRMLLCLSPSYIAGKMMIVRSIVSGAELVFEKPSNDVLADYEGEPFDLVAVVPSQVVGLLEHKERLKYVRAMLIGGSAVTSKLEKRLVALGVNAYASYGMTETCSHIALRKIGASDFFTAVGPVQFRIDERGCLCADVPHLSIKEVVTNDVVELLSPTEFRWIGRFDNVINTGGIKVYPEDVERILNKIIGDRFYISSQPSEKWGEEIVLVLERDIIGQEEEQMLFDKMKGVLSPYQVPKKIFCLPKFEETATGKVKRKKIK